MQPKPLQWPMFRPLASRRQRYLPEKDRKSLTERRPVDSNTVFRREECSRIMFKNEIVTNAARAAVQAMTSTPGQVVLGDPLRFAEPVADNRPETIPFTSETLHISPPTFQADSNSHMDSYFMMYLQHTRSKFSRVSFLNCLNFCRILYFIQQTKCPLC